MEENKQENQNIKNSAGNKMGLEPNVAAAISYLIPVITGVFFLYEEKNNKFVRFHAYQSIFFWIAAFVASLISNALFVVLIGFILSPLVHIAIIGLWLFLMWKAYKNEEYALPYIGKLAKQQADK
jgi:uncharacterized membrane protein